MKKLLVCIIIILSSVVFSSCGTKIGPLAEKIISEIDRSSDVNGECIVDIAKLTDFEWDTMIAIDAYCSYTEINGVLEIDMKSLFRGFTDKLVFLKDNKIVYKEIYKASVDKAYRFNLFFHYTLSCSYQVFSVDEAKIIGIRFNDPAYPNDNTQWRYNLTFK